MKTCPCLESQIKATESQVNACCPPVGLPFGPIGNWSAAGGEIGNPLHSTFSIPHSAFAGCHTMTLTKKNVLAKRTHLTFLLYKLKSRRRTARNDQRGRPASPCPAYRVTVAGDAGDIGCRHVPSWYPLPRALIPNQFSQRRMMAT